MNPVNIPRYMKHPEKTDLQVVGIEEESSCKGIENILKGIVTAISPELSEKTPIQIQGHLGYQTDKTKRKLSCDIRTANRHNKENISKAARENTKSNIKASPWYQILQLKV